MPQFRLPDLGEGVAEAEIDRWLVKEGDEVAEDEPLVEVITDKATVEIPSPFAGAVKRILVAAGEVVPVGTPLVTIGEDASSPMQPEAGDDGPASAAKSTPPVQPEAGDDGPASAAKSTPPVQPEAGDDGPASAAKATPPVRRLARALGVDLGRLTGSGPEGRVLRADVEAAAEPEPGAVGADQVVKPESDSERRVPLRGVRRAVAERMAEAHRLVPAVTHVEECDVTELDATRRLANERAPNGARLTYLPFIIKAVVVALKSHPALNATLDETRREIVFHDRYHIGVAVDTPEGLVVPVIHDADHKDLRAIAAELDELAARARAATIAADDLRGGTFTITSPGRFGGLLATPIVLHPQSSILGVHRATERPVVRDGQVVIRKIMNLSITFDHRVLDGMTAAQFALEVTELLEHPAILALRAD